VRAAEWWRTLAMLKKGCNRFPAQGLAGVQNPGSTAGQNHVAAHNKTPKINAEQFASRQLSIGKQR